MRRLPPLALAVALVVATVVGCSGGDGGGGLPEGRTPQAERGRTLVEQVGCVACHSPDGSKGAGPTWDGLAGSTVRLDDGTERVADAAYLRESILDPKAAVVDGYAPVMPRTDLPDEDVDAIVAYLQQLGED